MFKLVKYIGPHASVEAVGETFEQGVVRAVHTKLAVKLLRRPDLFEEVTRPPRDEPPAEPEPEPADTPVHEPMTSEPMESIEAILEE